MTVLTSLIAKIASCINFQLPIVIFKKSIILDMHHHITYMYINFQQNRTNRSVITVHTNVFATTNNFLLNRLFQTCIIVKRTCISIFCKIWLVDQSKPCTQVYVQKIAN